MPAEINAASTLKRFGAIAALMWLLFLVSSDGRFSVASVEAIAPTSTQREASSAVRPAGYPIDDLEDNACEPVAGPTGDRRGCVIIRKVVTGGGDDLFDFEISGDGPEGEFTLGDSEAVAYPIPAGLQLPAQIVIQEDVPTGWTVSIFCENLGFIRDDSTTPDIATLNLQDEVPSESAYIDCLVTNTPPEVDPCTPAPEFPTEGCIVIRKVVVGGTGNETFAFSLAGNSVTPATSNLGDGDAVSYTFDPNLATDAEIVITETIEDGWEVTISCDGLGYSDLVFDEEPGVATYTAAGDIFGGRMLDCTYTNTKTTPPPPSCNDDAQVGVAQVAPIDRCLLIEKVIFPVGLPAQDFAFQASGDISLENFVLGHGDVYGIPLDLDIGDTITITETLPLGWFSWKIDCSNNAGFSVTPNGSGSVILTAVDLGQAPARYAVCVFTNLPPSPPPVVGVPSTPTATATPTTTATPTATATAAPTSTPSVVNQGARPNVGGIFPQPGATFQPSPTPVAAAGLAIRPPSTGDAGLK